MTTHHRFFVKDGYIIDANNPANSCEAPSLDSEDDERRLREHVLWRRVSKFTEQLIINQAPVEEGPTGEEYKPWNRDSHSLSWMIFNMICASHLDRCTPSESNRSDWMPRRQKNGVQSLTSLSRFIDDIENLLTDFYRETEPELLDLVAFAALIIAEEFTRYARPDLWKEHDDAMTWDYCNGIGVHEGCGVSGSQWRRGMAAADNLAARARDVRANPSVFSEYTVAFVSEDEFPLRTDCPKGLGWQ